MNKQEVINEKEKKYTARLTFFDDEVNYLQKNSRACEPVYSFDNNTENETTRTRFTQSELEKLNVWNNPAFEVKEVKE